MSCYFEYVPDSHIDQQSGVAVYQSASDDEYQEHRCQVPECFYELSDCLDASEVPHAQLYEQLTYCINYEYLRVFPSLPPC